MTTITKTTVVLFAITILFATCGKNEESNKTKTLSSVVITNNDGILTYNYKYDTQGRLTEISLQNPYLVFYTFTYMADGKIEKIRHSYDGQSFVDFTYSYSDDSKVPDRMKYSGNLPAYTTDVIYSNNTLLFNDEEGDEYAVEGINVENNTFSSIVMDGKTYIIHFNRQLKNGLEKQSVLNIPLSMTMGNFLMYQFYGGLPLNAQVVTGLETSDGQQLNLQYETDATGYITKIKNGNVEYRYK